MGAAFDGGRGDGGDGGDVPGERADRSDRDGQQQSTRPHIDVVFVLDATGSMGDEIEPVKQHIWNIANQIASGNPRPELRVGLVIYRDRGDAEPTRMVPLTGDLDQMHTALMGVTAQGGGDYPEDVDAGLALALHEMNWGERSARMVFLVGDAPAQRYPEHDHDGLVRYAADRQIEVSTIECSGLDARGRSEFAAIAQRTHGMMTALTYAQDQQLADGRTQTILRQGGRVYVSDRRLTEEERSEGGDVLSAPRPGAPGPPPRWRPAEGAGRPGRGGAPLRRRRTTSPP
ncbi:MAG: VWA domain-containing protein [Deltaproteobacteria bacterium]|nr:VWA domain-containing protein [Deltaproteobacteria bacterium]